MSPISNNIANFVTSMTKPDAMAPIIGLEATVTGGRTVQAQKRGGKDEARERLIEEATGAIVWLWGVKFLNDYIGDPILKKLFGGNFDVGTDKILRTPFDNFMMKDIKKYKNSPKRKFSKRQVALIKATKVLASVLIADAFIGLVVPPLNQKLTRSLAKKKMEQKNQENNTQDKLDISSKNTENTKESLAFKGGGGIAAINVFTNAIEKTNTGKLLSTDAGLTSGRIYSARNNEERKEIAIRDIGSIYFYMWAQNHIASLLNYAETGRFSRLNPNSAKILDEKLVKFIESKGGSMTVEEFRNAILGKNPSEIKLPEGIESEFETAELSKMTKFMDKIRNKQTEPLKVIELDKLKKYKDFEKIWSRLEAMSQLQPNRKGIPVITKQQIIDAINVSQINDPVFLNKMFTKFTNKASNDPYKYVSNKKLYGLKTDMENYVKDICKNAKNGKINNESLKKMKNKNLTYSGINFVAGFSVAALFLSTLIPKFQYWVTKQKTGKDDFPGTYDLEKEIANA